MIVTVWILLIAAIMYILVHMGNVGEVERHNKASSVFNQKAITRWAIVTFWIAFLVFAFCTGIICEYIFGTMFK